MPRARARPGCGEAAARISSYAFVYVTGFERAERPEGTLVDEQELATRASSPSMRVVLPDVDVRGAAGPGAA